MQKVYLILCYSTEGLFDKLMTHLSVVVPVLNESSLIRELINQVKANVELITEDFEIILVDDGSQDETWELIKSEANLEKRIKGIKFSRNFGHHYAITAGLHKTSGEWVVVMDGDLQDRPEVIPELYKKAKSGYDVVFVSRQNRPEKLYYRVAQRIFYWLLRFLSGINFDSRQANFSIINKKVVEAFKIFPEHARFYGSTVKWLGFNRSFILADHGTRLSGKPSYTFRKRIKLASDIILAFSERPLRFAIGFGIIMSISAIMTAFVISWRAVYFGYTDLGFLSVLVAIFFVGGSILTVLGILGIYLGRVFNQVKNRPLYIISSEVNVN
jgi:glycosyltransferase involved in cell wall biosynthesis